MLDHVGFVVSDIARSRAFYGRALAPLGIELIMEITPQGAAGGTHLGYGEVGRPYFWISSGAEALRGRLHVAFRVADRRLVDAFHAAGLAAGGTDFGAPGIRAHYHPNYYGAFVLDPDGHNVEAVCHRPG